MASTLYAYEDHAGFVIANRETDDPYSDAAFVRRATAEMIADGYVATGFHPSQRAPVRRMGLVPSWAKTKAEIDARAAKSPAGVAQMEAAA